jgi:hypothetical protein
VPLVPALHACTLIVWLRPCGTLHCCCHAGEAPSFALKRRWDEDVVFKNQARGEPKAQRRFINDTIRNDFHRRFLDRYMK